MADHQVSACIRTVASTEARAGIHCSVGASIKRDTPPELLPPAAVKRLPNGEEVIVLRPYVRA